MAMKLIFTIALLALAAFAFADAGPGPMDMPGVTLHATIDGQPVPDGTSALLHCYTGDEEFRGPGGSWSCEAGVCTGGMYKLNPCARDANATFEFINAAWGRNYTTSPPVHLERGNDYDFNVSISTTSGTTGIAGEGRPQLMKQCGLSFVLAGLAAVLLVAVKR